MTSGAKRVLACGFIVAAIIAFLVGGLTADRFKTCKETTGWFGDSRIVCQANWDLGWPVAIAVFLVVLILVFQLSLLWSISDRLKLKPVDVEDEPSLRTTDCDGSSL